jgi:hypothetical protein
MALMLDRSARGKRKTSSARSIGSGTDANLKAPSLGCGVGGDLLRYHPATTLINTRHGAYRIGDQYLLCRGEGGSPLAAARWFDRVQQSS